MVAIAEWKPDPWDAATLGWIARSSSFALQCGALANRSGVR
jgi:hypothetical protein